MVNIILGAALAFTPALASGGSKADSVFQLRCRPFTKTALPKPVPQTDPRAVKRFQAINKEVKSGPHAILFLGDSLTEKWDPAIWQQHFAPRGALNAGVNGDRTEHLLWRLSHGNLDGPQPRAAVLLIGTNDVGWNRPPELVAEGIRANLEVLRSRLPNTRILLLALLPRSESPISARRRQISEVNHRIRNCDDGEHIFYAAVGDVLLDASRRLTPVISRDGVHLSPRGYALLASRLAVELDRMLPVGRQPSDVPNH